MRVLPFRHTIIIPVVLSSVAAFGCGGSASTRTIGPSATKCAVALSTSPTSFPSTGGNGTVAVTTARECSWSATSDSDWLTFTSATSGEGSGAVSFSVRPNGNAAPRAASVVVNDQSVRIAEEPAPCRFQLDRGGYAVPSSGGAGTVSLSAPSGCGWSAAAGADWVRVENPSGNGSAAVRFTVTANPGAARQAMLSIAGLPFTVEQQGRVTPAPSPAPTPPGPNPPGPNPPGPPNPPPGPNPPGPPEPPPPASVGVRIEGEIKKVSGSCPALSLEIDGPVDRVDAQARTTVITGSATAFSGAPCGDLEKKDKVRVWGTLGSDGRVAATRLEFLQR